MKAKIISILLFITLFYVLPLIPKIELVLTPQVLMLSITCIVLFMTQPPLTIKESQENKKRDKNSVWFIMGSVAAIQLSIILEWAYIQGSYSQFQWDVWTVLGLFLLIGGTVYRIWCISTLGKHFTTTVRTQESQQIITTAAYKYIRHPSYLGAYLAIIGSAVFMHTYFSILVAVILMFWAYRYRIKFEELALVEDFGNEYKAYQKNTKKLIPFVY